MFNAYEEAKAPREELTCLSHKTVALYPTADYCSLNLHMECVHLGCSGKDGVGRMWKDNGEIGTENYNSGKKVERGSGTSDIRESDPALIFSTYVSVCPVHTYIHIYVCILYIQYINIYLVCVHVYTCDRIIERYMLSALTLGVFSSLALYKNINYSIFMCDLLLLLCG